MNELIPRRGTVRLLALLLMAVLLLAAGCGGSSTSSKAPGGTAAPAEKPVVVALGADTRTLLPMKIVDMTTYQQIRNIYDTLLTRDPKTYALAPELATSWRALDDKTWEFKLRQGVKFHNGEPFTSESVKVTIEKILDKSWQSHYYTRFEMIDKIETPDDYTVILHTKQPSPILLLRMQGLLPMPPKLLKEKGIDELAKHPIGVGPYKFVSWTKDEKLELEANPDYWAGKPLIEKLVFRPIPEFSSRLSALLAGEVDVIQNIPVSAVEQVNSSGKARVESVPSSRVNYIALTNFKPGPLSDRRIRQALNYGVDVDGIIKYVMKGHAYRMAGALSNINPEVNKDLKPYPFDVAKAKALFQEAGVDPTKLTLTMDSPQGRYPMDKEVAQAIAAELKKNLGIEVKITYNEWGTHLDKIVKRQTGNMFLLGWGPALDAEGTIGDLAVKDRTYSGFAADPELQKMIDNARPIVDPVKRKAAWDAIQKKVYDEAMWIFLWQQEDLYGVSNRINFTPRADEEIEMWRATYRK
ncbi:MAG: ABC transporter substrate-binding protein [Firmicutes bacterium]|nr:ABC transporter substrate-binding protein [Bacillota bacterium]MCL5040064.1 ABC transporter substrate-binding protein [Bacillota bacterium]